MSSLLVGSKAVRGQLRFSIPAQTINSGEPGTLLVLRLVVTQVIDGDRMHAPEECFLGDGSGLLGGELFLLESMGSLVGPFFFSARLRSGIVVRNRRKTERERVLRLI
jgi:hypothetical protein